MKLNSQAATAFLMFAILGLGQDPGPSKTTELKAADSKSTDSKATEKSQLPAATARSSPGASSAHAPATQTPAPTPAEELKAVLAKMNQSAAGFKSFQADFEWEYYDGMVKVTDIQKGEAYFRREGKYGLDALYSFDPASDKGSLPKQALYKGGVFSLYEPKINRITEREVGKNKSDVDAFMSLGLGGRGDDLAAAFNVTWQGWETVEGVKTAKLEVAGKSSNIQKVFVRALLWIDPERDIALRQQFFLNKTDYRLTRYRNIKFNQAIADRVFKLKTKDSPEHVRLQ